MLFSELPETAFSTSLNPINNFIHPSSSVLYEAGTNKKLIYSIRSGVVKLLHVAQNGKTRIVRLLGKGTSIGLELLEGANSYNHTAVTIGEVDLCKIPVPTMRLLEEKYPVLCKQIRQQLQKQLDLADQWAFSLGTGSVKQRVAQLILILEEFFADESGAFTLLQREDMSAMIAISDQTISREVAELKRLNLLIKSKSRDNLYTCNTAELQKRAQLTK